MNVATSIVSPEDVGLSAARLSYIPNYFASYVDRGKLPCVSTLVARHGKIAHFESIGQRDPETRSPITADTIFRIYSMTKPITSVALMMLYEEGRFELGHEVSRYIPEFKNLKVWAGGSADSYQTKAVDREMTVRDLLTHTSGLTYGFMRTHPVDALYRKADIDGARTGNMTLAEMCTRLAEIPLLFSPGTQWSYSVATDVCGRLVEVLSGLPLDQFFESRIFKPLGMVDTGFHVPADKIHRLAANYEKNLQTKETRLADPASADSIYAMSRSYLSGGGGLVSTMMDYYRFCQMLLNGGTLEGVRLLSRKTVEFMRLNHLPDNQTIREMDRSGFSETGMDGVGFGLGFSVVLDPADAKTVGSIGNYSWGGLASTYFWIDPEEDLLAILMTQLMPSRAYPLRPQLQQLVYASLID